MPRKSLLHRLLTDQLGATAVEYGLICALIVIASIGAFQLVADENMINWMKVSSATMKAANSTGG